MLQLTTLGVMAFDKCFSSFGEVFWRDPDKVSIATKSTCNQAGTLSRHDDATCLSFSQLFGWLLCGLKGRGHVFISQSFLALSAFHKTI